MRNFLLAMTGVQKQLLIVAAVFLLGLNGAQADAKGWTAQKAAQYIPVLGAPGYRLQGRYINEEVTRVQQELLITAVSLQTGVSKDSLRLEVERRNKLFQSGKLSDKDVLDLRPAQTASVLVGQGGGGGAAGGAAGAAQEGDAEDTNKDAAFGIRQRYFDRFPYALAAFRADVKVPVSGGTGGPGAAGAAAAGGAGGIAGILSGLLGSEGAGPQGPVNLQRSLGTTIDSSGVQTKEGQQAQVVAYNFVVKFCNDNPANGVCYFQPLLIATDVPATYRDLELFQTAMTGVHGMPLSDTQFQILDRENKQRFLELLFDPERFMWLSVNTGQMQGAAAANSLGGAGETSFNNFFEKVTGGNAAGGSAGGGGGFGSAIKGGDLINVANDTPVAFGGSQNPHKSKREAVFMVQQMYKFVFLPMAILFLLPGAVLTQTKGFVSRGILSNSGPDEMASPFDGILRSIIAIFLIPATQLIVSYSIDVGNSLAGSVKPWISKTLILDVWAQKQTYNVPVDNVDNGILPPTPRNLTGGLTGGIPGVSSGGSGSGGGGGGGFSVNIPGLPAAVNTAIGSALNRAVSNLLSSSGLGSLANSPTIFGAGGQGKAAQIDETQTIQESQLWLSQIMQLVFNFVCYAFSYMLIVLTAYQLVFMCYLYLLGPLCACFWAWPKITDKMFRNIFANWLNSVITLSLWRFYWCVILAIMTVRLEVLFESGGFNVNAQYELMVFCCFLGLMLYVPFVPFDFNPGAAAEAVMQKGAQMGQTVAQGAAGLAKEAGVPDSVIQQGMSQVNQATTAMQQFGGGLQSGTTYDGLRPGVNPDGTLERGSGGQQGQGGSGQRAGEPAIVAPPPVAPGGAGQVQPGGTSPVQAAAGGAGEVAVPGTTPEAPAAGGPAGAPTGLAPQPGQGSPLAQLNAALFNPSNAGSGQINSLRQGIGRSIDKLVSSGSISADTGAMLKQASGITIPSAPTTGSSPKGAPPIGPIAEAPQDKKDPPFPPPPPAK